jgi:RNA polymerase sigma-70 factor, ECF subfamily
MFTKLRYQKCVLDHKDRVYRYALYTLRSEADAEDAAQEVFIKLWNKFDTINPLKVKSWLMRTTYNHCIDMIRRRKRTSDRHVEIQEFQNFDDEVTTGIDPRKDMEHKTLGKRIDTAVGELPEKVRTVFLMYEIQGFKYREISDSLGIPLNTVKVHLLRARKLLQQELNYEKNF